MTTEENKATEVEAVTEQPGKISEDGGGTDAAGDTITMTPAQLKKRLERAEAAALKKAQSQFEQKQKEAEMSEVEKHKAKIEELEKELVKSNEISLKTQVDTQIKLIANAKGIDPELAVLALDRSGIDPSDMETTVTEALTQLVNKHPNLRTNTMDVGVRGKPVGDGGNVPTITREDVSKMTPAEINKNWDVIKKANIL